MSKKKTFSSITTVNGLRLAVWINKISGTVFGQMTDTGLGANGTEVAVFQLGPEDELILVHDDSGVCDGWESEEAFQAGAPWLLGRMIAMRSGYHG